MRAQVVAETQRPGRMVNDVTRELGREASHVSAWRMLARNGRLVLPAPKEVVEFAATVLAPPKGEAGIAEAIGPESVMRALTIRQEPGPSDERIAAMVRALSAA